MHTISITYYLDRLQNIFPELYFHFKWNGKLGWRDRRELIEQGQLALRRHAFVRHDAEQAAGRHAGVIDERLKMLARRKPLAQFPRADGGDGNAQPDGDFFQGNLVLPPPRAECFRKAGANIAAEWRVGLLHHMEINQELSLRQFVGESWQH